MVSCLFLQLEFLINTIFAGRLNDPAKLAGVGLGTTLLNVVCFIPLMGMNGAVETLVSQAFGAQQLKLCGVYLNRGRLINTILYIPLAVVLCYSRQILGALGQQAVVIQYAHEYIIICLPGIYLRMMFDMKKRFLNCLNIAWVPMLTQVGATLLHIVWCYAFVERFELQVMGLGIATLITDLSLVVMIELYSLMVPQIKESQVCFDKYALQGWCEYMKLGVPAAVMICAEWWAFEILIFLSGILGVQQQASMVICFQIVAQTFMINLGIQEASAALIGNQIGALNVQLAKRYAKIITCLGMTIGFFISLTLWLLREKVAGIFTKDPTLINMVISILPIICISNFTLDAALMSQLGCIRALGLQTQGALANIFSYYCISIPMACVFAFVTDMGVFGLWLGQYIGVFAITVVLSSIIYRADWRSLSIKAKIRMQEDSINQKDRDLGDISTELNTSIEF